MSGRKTPLEERIRRGQEAKQVTENRYFKEAVEYLRESYTSMLLSTRVEEKEIREELYMMVRVLYTVKGHIEAYVVDGKVAQSELDRKNDR